MKTSNKLLLSALIIFLISLTIYNFALKAEYLTNNYKLPYLNYNKTKIKGFTEIQLNAANMMNVELKQGPFAIYIGKRNDDSVQIDKVGNRLIINLNLQEKPEMRSDDGSKEKFINEHRYNNIIIVCPNLSLLKTDDAFLVKGKKLEKYNYTNGSPYDSHRMISLEMFKLDSLTLMQTGRSQVSLSANVIKSIKADVGRQSSIIIRNNIIESMALDIRAGGELSLGKLEGFKPNLPTKFKYQFSDSSSVTLNGATLRTIIKKQP